MKQTRRCLIPVVVLAFSAAAHTVAAAPDTARLREERGRIQSELNAITKKYVGAEARLGLTQTRIEEAVLELQEAEETLAASRDALGRRAASVYRSGPVSFLTVLLESKGFAEFTRRMQFLEHASRADSATATRAGRARSQVLDLSAQLEHGRAKEKTILDELRVQARELTVRLDRAVALEARLAADDQERLRREQERRARARPGQFVCPVDGPHALTDSYGDPRSGGRRHQGIDIMATRGTPAAAVSDGAITRMNQSTLGGVSLYLRGNDGTEYFYTHLDRYAGVSVGQAVSAGTHVAYVGSTGNAGTPHLHFEVHPGGGASIDPFPMAKAACG